MVFKSAETTHIFFRKTYFLLLLHCPSNKLYQPVEKLLAGGLKKQWKRMFLSPRLSPELAISSNKKSHLHKLQRQASTAVQQSVGCRSSQVLYLDYVCVSAWNISSWAIFLKTIQTNHLNLLTSHFPVVLLKRASVSVTSTCLAGAATRWNLVFTSSLWTTTLMKQRTPNLDQ